MATNPLPKRIAIDIADIQKQEYQSQGIHYWSNEANITQGQLLIWGPKDSLYEDMPMLYSVQFPVPGYPFEPPRVLFLTNDGYTRFHPNMYKEGKVCLSILGTWEGPKWAATMRLSTVAITIQSLMDNNPIAHEPGYANRNDATTRAYNDFIGYRCILFLVNLLSYYSKNGKVPSWLENFEEEFIAHLPGLLQRLEKRLSMKTQKQVWSSIPYSMTGKTNYAELRSKLNPIISKLEPNKN